MFRHRPVIAVLTCVAVAAALGPQAGAHPRKKASATESGAVVAEWNRITQATVFPQVGPTPIPIGQVHFGLVHLAMYDAVDEAVEAGRDASASAAAAAAAHDVLVHHFPAAKSSLDADLASTLSALPADARARGEAIGHEVAADQIEDREDDGFKPPGGITFTRAAGPGVWRPTADNSATFLAPWLGFARPLVLDSVEDVDPGSPDDLDSRAYARDFREAKRVGSITSTFRTDAQTATARFFNFSVPIQWNTPLREMARSMTAADAARLLGLANVSAADAVIACWWEKFTEPFWRPITAIREADTDGNRRTVADPTWTPLAQTPPYPDWPSGHACLTSAYSSALEEVAETDAVTVVLPSVVNSVSLSRTYTDLDDLRDDAFMARIWLGYHFRVAMEGGYDLGEETVEELESRFDPIR